MVVDNEFLKKIKDFGLNSYEAKLWASLLSRGVSSAGELSDIANVPRSRTYDVLESLEKKGFIIMKLGKPIKYIAVPPLEVLERVKKQIMYEADKSSKVLDDLKDSSLLNELNLLHTKGVDLVNPNDLSGALKGRKNYYNHIESLISNAEKSICLVTTETGILRKYNILSNLLPKLSKKGVEIKIAAPLSKEAYNKVKNLGAYAEFKNPGNINGRFIIVDDTHISFSLLDGEKTHHSYDSGIWVKTPFFAQTMSDMFGAIWPGMKKY